MSPQHNSRGGYSVVLGAPIYFQRHADLCLMAGVLRPERNEDGS